MHYRMTIDRTIKHAGHCLLALIVLVAPGVMQPLAAQVAGAEKHIAVSLVAESRTPAPGTTTTLAIVMRPQAGWHGYWSTPGDAGLANKIAWTLPAGVKAGAPEYPLPERLVVGGLMNHVYDKPYALLLPLVIPQGTAIGTRLPIRARLDYLVCTKEACLPESAEVATDVTIGAGGIAQDHKADFALWRQAMPRALGSGAQFETAKGRLRLALSLPQGLEIGAPHLFVDAADVVQFAAPQTFSRRGDQLIVETAAAEGAAPASFGAVLDLGTKTAFKFQATPGTVPAAGTAIISGKATPQSDGGSSVIGLTLLAFGGAVLGGLILNVMPCVFPILSLKALSLARSGDNHGEARREAVAYSAGVIMVCVVLGLLILGLRAGGSQVGWAFQLQNPSVIFGLVLLVGAIAFNLADLFDFTTISAGSSLTTKTGAAGAFWTGALAAFIATPCTGPFMAAALGAALVLPFFAAILIFVGLGLGLALPFLAIGFIPRLRKSLPKPGAWMNTFRHILAVPMFITGLGLLWVLGNQAGTTGILLALLALLILCIGLWMTGLRQRSMKEKAWIPSMIALILAASTVALLPATNGNAATATAQDAAAHNRQVFDGAKLAALRAAGKPVFLYFTADWCLSCKVNEKAAIERAETQKAFADAGVVTMVGDWTRGDAVITRFLQDFKRSGVPLYLWYAPGKEAQVLPQILTPASLSALAEDSRRR